MIIELLTKAELSALNKKSMKYKLAVAEKDYFLAVVSKIIYNSSLKDKIIFKGGTAIHHCYLPYLRFSEDLDFTSLDKSITYEEVKSVLESNDFLEIKKHYISKATIKIERLKYTGPLALPNSLKVEIDFIQNVVLPAREIEYKNPWGIETKVMVMDINEICAEKIRAMNDRARYRDFYDIYLIMEYFKLNLKEISALIRKKEIRKPLSRSSILENWKITLEEKEEELGEIYYTKNISNTDIEDIIDRISVLL